MGMIDANIHRVLNRTIVVGRLIVEQQTFMIDPKPEDIGRRVWRMGPVFREEGTLTMFHGWWAYVRWTGDISSQQVPVSDLEWVEERTL